MTQDLQATINERIEQIQALQAQLDSGKLDKKEAKKATKEIANLEKMNKKAAFWGGMSNKLETNGAKLQETGKAMQKAGLKTTAAVWTPGLYVGYKVAKSIKGKAASRVEEIDEEAFYSTETTVELSREDYEWLINRVKELEVKE